MKKCPSCGMENTATEDYCLGCGTELGASAPSTPGPGQTATSASVAAPGPQPTGLAAFTLSFGDQSIPMYEGQTFTIRRKGTGPADLELEADDVSGTPLVLTVNNGKMEVGYDDAVSKSWAVLKNVAPGQKVEVDPGEAIMAGAGTVIFVS